MVGVNRAEFFALPVCSFDQAFCLFAQTPVRPTVGDRRSRERANFFEDEDDDEDEYEANSAMTGQKTRGLPASEQGMTKSTTSVYWPGVSPDAKGTNLYNPILVRYFRRSDRETLSRRRYAGSVTLRKQ